MYIYCNNSYRNFVTFNFIITVITIIIIVIIMMTTVIINVT
jgi:hypothetical protein